MSVVKTGDERKRLRSSVSLRKGPRLGLGCDEKDQQPGPTWHVSRDLE